MATAKGKLKVKRPENADVDVRRIGTTLELHYRKPQYAPGCFLLVWLSGWTAGCVMLIFLVISEPKVFSFLFAIPFWASWIFVFCLVSRMLLGREQLRLTPSELEYSRYIVVRTSCRRVRADELLRAKLGSEKSGLMIETEGAPIRFARGLDRVEQRWLVALVNEYIGAAKGEVPAEEVDQVIEEASDPKQPTRPARTVLKLGRMPTTAPSESRWRLERELGDLHFTARGRWDVAAIGGATFVFLFWNGIVSVFVWQLFQKFEWSLFFFLIPFEIIGLIIALGWLSVVFAPLWRDSWRFGRREIRHRSGPLGLGPTKRYAVVPLEHIELHRQPAKKKTANTVAAKPGGYFLRVVTKEGSPLVEINGLTRGESRWMGDVVLREFPSWFGY